MSSFLAERKCQKETRLVDISLQKVFGPAGFFLFTVIDEQVHFVRSDSSVRLQTDNFRLHDEKTVN
jgi:hypothetical protein